MPRPLAKKSAATHQERVEKIRYSVYQSLKTNGADFESTLAKYAAMLPLERDLLIEAFPEAALSLS